MVWKCSIEILGHVFTIVNSHSDLMMYNRSNEEPVTMGHEGVGVIEKIHPSVEGKGFEVGDAVGCGYFLDW
jgi:D-arabinose 1-dehydrogenase-like Zn-dependent alcohol dehydrogenase